MAKSFIAEDRQQNEDMKRASDLVDRDRDAQIAMTYRKYDDLTTDLPTLERQIRQLMMHQAFSIWHIGKRLQHIRDERLYKERGLASFRDYVSEYLPMSRQHAYRYIALVETFQRTLVEKHGTVLMPAVPVVKRLDNHGKEQVTTFIQEEGDNLSQNKLREWLSQLKNPADPDSQKRQPGRAPTKASIRVRRGANGLLELESDLGDSDLLARLAVVFEIESIEL